MSEFVKTKKKGFTLIELLIAISLIAILSGVLLAVINPKGIQKKARDSQRESDLAKIKVALESYFADNRKYPIKSDEWGKIGNTLFVLKGKYISNLPEDPKPSGTDCTTTGWHNYFYKSNATGSKYVLATNLEAGGGTTCPVEEICAKQCGGSTTIYYTTAD